MTVTIVTTAPSAPPAARRARRILTTVCAAALALAAPAHAASPAAQPAPQPWERWLPKSYAQAQAGETLPRPRAWWTEFQSDELNELVDLALDNNFDLRAAVARLTRTQAEATQAAAGRLPTLDAVARAQYLAPEFGIGTAPTRADFNTRKIYQVGLRAAYEVDLWGRAAYEEKAAMARVRSSRYAKDALALSLTGDVVNGYFSYLTLQDREAQLQARMTADEDLLKTVRRRATAGDASALEVEQQAATLLTSQAELAAVQAQKERAFVQLAYLIGRPPQMLHLQGAKLSDIKAPVITPSTPDRLLCQRPDIRRAEADLAASNADIAAARAALFPSLNLAAAGGYGSSGLGDVFAPQRLFADLSSVLVQQIFDGGRRAAERDARLARKTELLESYQGTILAAVRDVEQAMTSVRLSSAREAQIGASADGTGRLVTLTERAWTRGNLGYPSVLEARRAAALAHDAALTARLDRLRAAVDLYKAVGGGSEDEAACAPVNPAEAKSKGKRRW